METMTRGGGISQRLTARSMKPLTLATSKALRTRQKSASTEYGNQLHVSNLLGHDD
jgi:hypothetical protein